VKWATKAAIFIPDIVSKRRLSNQGDPPIGAIGMGSNPHTQIPALRSSGARSKLHDVEFPDGREPKVPSRAGLLGTGLRCGETGMRAMSLADNRRH
jgi:hypothetical protein